MKRVKRLFACLLALTMMLGLSATVFAEEQTETTPMTVTIKKVYKLEGAGTSPAETFTLKQTGKEVVDGEAAEAPDLGTITGAEFAAGEAKASGTEKDITVALPEYTSVGVYEYTLKEVDETTGITGTTAGVTYYGNDIKLVVTVINGENGNLRIAGVHTEDTADGNSKKSNTIVNTYSAGTLNVSKTVTGNLGDKDKYFEFKVTLTGETGKTYGDSYTVTGGSNAANPGTIKIGEETTFKLKDGETISIANLPYNVTYAVTETEADGYTTKVKVNGNEIEGNTVTEQKINSAAQNVEFTNDKNKGDIDTGVYLDNLPYILVFAGVLAIAVVFAVRRRRFED